VTRLILTSTGVSLMLTNIADLVIPFSFRFVLGAVAL
jgi:hypothetical protein